MNKITQALFLFLFFGWNVFAQTANWSPGSNPAYTNFPVNNSGQINGFCRISQMKFHATNANKMYAVTGEGGFFASNDAGSTWTVKAGTENLTGNCASLCIDYTNDQIIYLGSGDANYFSNGQGIYKSTDGGTTFTATTLTNCLVIEILQDPNNSGTFVAATNKGIYKSTNNGSTWTATTSTAIQFCDLKRNAAVGSSILYACTRENSSRVYRSTDFGTTWTQITSGITTATTFITAGGRIGVTPADPNVVYFEAIGGGGIIHKSTDGGLTFTVIRGEGAGTAALPYLTFYDFDNSGGNGGQGNYNNAICIDAANPAKIYLQAHNTWLSNDSGATWTELTHWSTKVHTDMHQLQQSPFDATKLFSCNDGGIWLSTDGGNNWTTKSNGLYAYEIYGNCGKNSHTDRYNITIGTQDNGRVYRNANGWFCIGGGDDTRQKEYDYLPNGGYYYEKTNASRKAASGGASSPNGFTTSGNYYEFLAFNRTNVNLGFMWFTDNNLYRCTNLSAATPTWTSVFTFSAPVVAMHSSIADSNRLYVITNDAKILVSSNALSASPTFTTFTLPTASNTIASIAAIANNANTVYISINNRVYVSTNSGANWTNITYNLPNVNHRRILAEEYGGTQELVFIATNNAVYYKKAGQTTWTNYSTNLPGRRAPTDFSMYDDGQGQSVIRYYSYGRGVWETPFANLRVLSSSFDVSQKVYCATGPVTYTDYSLGNPTSWSWSFPGGTPSTSTLQNPVVTYSSPGLYGATLTVSDGVTSSTLSRSNLFLVMASAPTVNTSCTIASNSNSGNGFGIGIGLFTVGNIYSPTSSADGAYNDYTCSQWTTLTQGSTYNATITTGTTNAEGAKVYIDLNNNGIFETTEAVISYPSNTTGTRTLSFTVPSTGVVLNTGLRLRVVSRFNSIPSTACDVSTYGQAEDYTVYIVPVPSAVLSNGTGSSAICVGQSANLKVNIVGGTSPYTVTISDGTNNQVVNNYTSGSNIPVSPLTNTNYSLVSVLDIFGTSIVPVSGSGSVTINSYTITASAGANGSISPNGSTVVNCGANQTYTITPNSCYQIATVLVDGVNNPAAVSSGTFTFSNVSASHTISVTFSLRTNTLSASAGANGTISPNGATVVNCGSNQTYTITPNACYQIADVLVDGISQGAIASYTFTNVTINHTISATFSLRTYAINASAGANGTIAPNGTTNVNCGSSQTYTITPNACYQIADVSVDGLSLGAIGSYTFSNVTVNHTIVATFSPITYTITASAGSNGTISSSGATSVNCGTNKTYTITPNTCYQVATVLVDGISQGAITTYTFTNVTGNHTISATFSSTTVTYYADRDGDGFGDLATPLLSCTGPPIFSGNPAVTNSTDCNDFAFSATNSCATIVNLKLFIEGYYVGNNLMRAVKMNQGVGSVTTYVDDIIVELRNTVTPHSVVTSTTAALQTNGSAVCTFATGPVGFFYIVIRYNNTIQTWTADPVHVDSAAATTYDFSTAASKAYGSNMVELQPGVYGIYIGDLNQDGNIDTIDYPLWENDSNNFLSGQYPSDLNGDGNVDTIDYPFLQNNSNNFISIIRP